MFEEIYGNPLVGGGCSSSGSATIATYCSLLRKIWEVLQWDTEDAIYSLMKLPNMSALFRGVKSQGD